MTPRRPRVLVVDDEQENLDAFRRTFRNLYEMKFALSVRAAIELLAHESFDVALVDYAMPGGNGVELARHALTARPEMARLMVTAHGELPDVVQARAHGLLHGIIFKPWERDEVVRWIDACCRISAYANRTR